MKRVGVLTATLVQPVRVKVRCLIICPLQDCCGRPGPFSNRATAGRAVLVQPVAAAMAEEQQL